MMKIDDLCNLMIYEYPILYRVYKNPFLSRMLALEHLFFTIGNGYDWSIKGVLYNTNNPRSKPIELPEDYFDKLLFDFRLHDKQKEFAELLRSKGLYFYTPDRSHSLMPSPTEFYFEATYEQAEELFSWDKFGASTINLMLKPKIKPYLAQTKAIFSPYTICEYSAIAELINRKTNSYHIENFSFDDFPPKPDYIAACMDLVLFTKNHFEKNPPADEKQIDYLNKFIAMYKK